ncbi:general transcription factor 3C polypeptide 2 [Trichonephila clavata]|uniref:General transcription factor 3C polypeptide 2 n=1 Tax=Trichonephila clavata TaxID=2740835 RepID=A0A8X6KWU9_TRICU|nr:general transcription factor 3C polypeptide 2 [Trichonephila clavata]
MEAEHLNHNSTVSNTINSDLTKELTQDSNIKNSTKNILESVCNDFESIEVEAPKEKKYTTLKKLKVPSDFDEYSNVGNKITREPVIGNTSYIFEDTIHSNSESNQTDINNSLNYENANISSVVVAPSLNSQNLNSEDVNSNKDVQAEMLPLQDSAKVGFVPENFSPEKNLSSVAELADAELVRTSENSVSIIISNPRFIQVVRTERSDIPADTSDLALNNNKSSEKGNMNKDTAESPLSDYSLQKTNIDVDSHPEVSHEIIYANDVAESSDSCNSPHTSTPKSYLSKKERNETYFRSRAEVGRVTKARRITAKLKTEWAKKLVENGFLMCPMLGCFQKYRTIANFITHYKHCCCGTEKVLKHCPYCASVIFSSSKAVLHHMKVEHPERLEEYKASYPEPQDMHENFDISDEDNSRLEVTQSDKFIKSPKKRKFLAKENRLSPKTRILKHKIKTMSESVIENSKIKECGHFDKIISRISSVNDKTNTLHTDENKISKDRRKRRLFLTGHVVAAEKYFEDERDAEMNKEEHSVNYTQEKEKINTKSRLVLNMDRYKRYSQYLTVTRDWASHRRTYSRPKNSDSVLDSSNLVNMQNESSESDIHQLNSSLESSSISLNHNEPFSLSQSICDRNLSTEISSFEDSLESNIIFTNKKSVENTMQKDSMTDTVVNNKIHDLSSETIVPERRPCYLNQSNIVSKSTSLLKSDIIRKHSMRITPIITYGKIPDSLLKKSDEKRPPVIDFDSFVKNSSVTQKGKNISKRKKVYNSVKPAKHNKEDGIKHPHNEPVVYEVKRKRGRPRKVDVKDNPDICEKEIVRQKMLQSKTDHKTYDKSPSSKFRKNGVKIKTTISRRRVVKNTKKSAPSAKGQSRINSKIDSSFQQRKWMKLSAQARFSLKKAIMCGVKRSVEKFRTMSRKKSRVHVKSVKCVQENQDINFSNKTSEASDHNYSAGASMIISHIDEDVNNCFQNYVEVQGEEIVCMSSKEKEDSKLQKEVILSSQSMCQEIVHTDIHGCITDDSHSSPLSHTLKTPENISKSNSNGVHLDCIPSVPDLNTPLDSTTPVLVKRSRGRPRKNNIHKLADSSPKLADRSPKLADSSPKLADNSPKLADNSPKLADSSTSGAVRKSERVRKRKLVGEGDSFSDKHSKIEESSPSQKSNLEQPERTGRRGRPRKHPKVEKNLSDSKTSEPPLDITIPTDDSSVNDKSLDNSNTTRNVPRKSKRRKNLIEKHDEVREDTEVDGELEKTKYINEKHQEKQEDFPVSAHSSTCIHSQEKKKGLILPLKKRKQIGETEEISIKNNSSVCTCKESTVLMPTKEASKRKVTFEEPVSCKIRASIPVNLQSTISHSCEKKNTDILLKHHSAEKLAISQNSCENIFPEFEPDLNKFEFCNGKYEEYFKTKIHIKIDDSPDWIKLKCFESITHEGSNKATFFVGGPVQSSAFCPTPRNKIVNQYIAVASSHILYNRHSYIHTKNLGGFIQFWNLGCLHESLVLKQVPLMELAIYHTHGLISQMKWCPKGCYEAASKTDGLPRLGLLALSCSDGSVRIYSIPQPNLLPKTHSKGTSPVYCTSPSVMLTPLFGGPCSATRKSMATCIEWQKNGQQIAAGFGNGTICIWMLKTSTIISTYDEKRLLNIQPYIVFQAGGTPVTSISFAPLINCRWLVSSSFDKTLRFFDLYDTCMPFCSVKRGFAFNCEWGTDFCGAYVSLHDGILFKGSSFAKECGIEEPAAQNISGSVTSLTYSSISSITKAQAIADMTGAVSLNFVHNLYDQAKVPCDDFGHVIFQTQVVALDLKKNCAKVNTHEVASVIDEMENIADVIDSLVSYCETQTVYVSSHSDSTSAITKRPAAKNVAQSIKENLYCKFDATTSETVAEPELEDKSIQKRNKKLLNDLIEYIVVKESEENSLQELLNNLIESVVTKESEENSLQELLNNLIESVVTKESEENSLQELLNNLIESVVTKESEENSLRELLNNLIESVVTKESEENSLRELLDNLIKSVVTKESEEKFIQETNKKLLYSLIESVVMKESEEKSLLETNKELLVSLIESVVTKESKEKSLLETNKELLAYLIESVVTKESKEKSLLEINKKLLNSLIELVVMRESEEKSLLESNKELLDNLIESVVMKESEKESLQELNKELFDDLIESVVMKEPEEKPLLKTNKELLTSQVLLESVVTKESEEKSLKEVNKVLHTYLVESVVTKESKEKSLLETNEKLLNSLIELVVRKESEEKSVLETNRELLTNLIESVVIKESEEKSLLETNEKLLNSLIEKVVMKESEEKSVLESNKELLTDLIESVVIKESEEKYLLETNKKLLYNLIESVVMKESEEKFLIETSKELLVNLIESVVRKESEEKALQETYKEVLNNLIESVVMKEAEEKSLLETTKELLNNIIESVVKKESGKKTLQETNKEFFDNHSEVNLMHSEEKPLQKTNGELLDSESVSVMNSKEKSKEKNMVEASILAHLGNDKENLKENLCTETNLDSGNLHIHTEVAVANNIVEENSFNNHKHLGLRCCLLHCDSDSDFSDTLQNEVTNFSEDSMLSECSYDSCQSSHSFCYSTESLGLDVPPENQTALQKDLECAHPSSSSPPPPKSFSELNVNTTSCVPENCSNQPSFEGFISNIEGNSVTAEELECSEVLDPMPDIQDKSLDESGDDMNLNQSHSLSIPQTSEAQSLTSKDDVQCDYFEEEHNHVPNLLPCASTPSQTINELSAPSNDSSICTDDDIHVLGSDSSKEPKSSNLVYESLYPKSSKPFPQTSKTTKVTSNSRKVCNSIENSDEIDENVGEKLFHESPSYATLTSKYGLVFKDTLSAESERDLSTGEKKDSLPFENESNILSAVNTISWNPNHGCHLWLFVAGNSGIARLACVSELSKKENASVSSQESIK